MLKTGLRAKFTQNEQLKRALFVTSGSILAEASPYDGIFGIALTAEAAASVKPDQWPGRNLLGKALMQIRAELSGGMDVADIIDSSRLDSINKILRMGKLADIKRFNL